MNCVADGPMAVEVGAEAAASRMLVPNGLGHTLLVGDCMARDAGGGINGTMGADPWRALTQCCAGLSMGATAPMPALKSL